MPLGTLLHVPSEPATAHDRQVPVQAPMQQTPCWQEPELHWAGVVQVAPRGSRPQLVPVQVFGDAQSAVVLQVVRHMPVPHANGSHIDVLAAWQVPVPLQVRADVSVDPVQVAAAHCVPAAYSRHAPAPLQEPSVLQAVVPRSAHWFSGSAPFATLVQVPTVPASAQDWQVPPQAVMQQTPCAQKPDRHSPPEPQATPMSFLAQLPPMHVNGATQWLSTVQVVLHAPAPQVYWLHDVVVAAWQVPVPLHDCADVSVDPVQLCAAHCVPAAYSRQPPAPSQNPSVPQVDSA
jgi:hypothetical protein